MATAEWQIIGDIGGSFGRGRGHFCSKLLKEKIEEREIPSLSMKSRLEREDNMDSVPYIQVYSPVFGSTAWFGSTE